MRGIKGAPEHDRNDMYGISPNKKNRTDMPPAESVAEKAFAAGDAMPYLAMRMDYCTLL